MRYRLAMAACVVALGALLAAAYEQAEGKSRTSEARRMHGCNLMAEVSRTRADTLLTIKTCTDWSVPQPFPVVRRKTK